MERERPPREQRRIVHVTTVHRPFDPRIFHKQLGTLQNAGFDTHLVAPHDRAERRDGVSIHPLPTGRRAWHARLLLQPLAYRRARALNADLYQIHDPELIPMAWLLRQTSGARVIYDVHEDYRTKGPVWGRVLRALERWAFRWVDHVLLAESSYQSVVEGTAADHTYILNYFRPFGEDATASPKPAKQPIRLLYTGTLSNRRGLRAMIDLAEAIRRRGRPERLDVVGVCNRDRQRAAADARIRDHDLTNIVTRVGWDTYVPPSRMPPYYRRADVGLFLAEPHSNLIRSMPTKFYEYLHYGLPIICSDLPLWRQFIEENECGVVVPPGDTEAVLGVLDRWRAQPDRYRTFAQNARAAASKYRWEQMSPRLVRVYRHLLGPGEGRRAE